MNGSMPERCPRPTSASAPGSFAMRRKLIPHSPRCATHAPRNGMTVSLTQPPGDPFQVITSKAQISADVLVCYLSIVLPGTANIVRGIESNGVEPWDRAAISEGFLVAPPGGGTRLASASPAGCRMFCDNHSERHPVVPSRGETRPGDTKAHLSGPFSR